MRQMQNMMNSFFGGNPMAPASGRSRSMSLMPFDNGMDNNMNSMNMMSPFGFPSMNMNQLMRSMGQMPTADPNCHSFSSSSVMTMTTGPDGKPQVSWQTFVAVFVRFTRSLTYLLI